VDETYGVGAAGLPEPIEAEPDDEIGTLPEAAPHDDYTPFSVDTPGSCGIISDLHLPYHDPETVRAWVKDCKRMGVKSLLLNGDVLDFYQLSAYVRDPSKPRMREELDKGRQLFAYLRANFPKAQIVMKTGNHDERLDKYLATHAPELADVDDFRLPSLLRANQYGIDWVTDKRVVMVGKLCVVHGHEYKGGANVVPARWLYLRTGESTLMGHLHQPSFYSFRTITGREVGMWSTGCACHLRPLYAPLNQWALGWALVETFTGGEFHVHNRQVLRSGRVV
jgi:predicted phosphodiesterase